MKKIDIHDEKELIAYGNDFFTKSDNYNRSLHRKWLLNILFVIGEQNCSVNRQTGGIDRVKVENDPEWTVRVVNNRVMPIYRTMMAKLTKNKPIPIATANSLEETDIQAARAVTKLEVNHWLNLELDDKHQEIVAWLICCGNAFVKQFYNPDKGALISTDDDILAEVEHSLEEELENDEEILKVKGALEKTKNSGLNIGDTDLVVRSPFTCRNQPGITNMDKMTIFGDSEFLTTEDVYDKYEVEIEPGTNKDKYVHNINIGEVIHTGEMNLDTKNDLIEVREIYILPNAQFPEGATYKWAEDKMLEKPKPCNKIPIRHCGLIRIPGAFWYQDLISDIVPMQIRWNELLSKIEMHNDLYNDPPVVLDPDSIDIDEWVARPGLLLEKKFSGGDAPFVLPVPVLDQAIFQEINLLDKQFEIVPVLNKVSFGKDTPNARSGLAINYLQEKDDDVIRPLINEIENFYTKVFKDDLQLCKDNYSEDRGFAVVGENNKTEWIEFSRSYLDANIDVMIEPGSAMPRSIAAQQSMVLELMDRGFFVDPKTGQMDYTRISRYMEFGSIEEMYEDATIDSDHAKRCINMLKDGIPVRVEEWFNPIVHLYELNRFRKTAEYDDLDSSIRFLFENYALQCTSLMQPSAAPAVPGGVTGTESSPPSIPAPNQGAGKPTVQGGNSSPMTDKDIAEYMMRIKKLQPEVYNKMMNSDPEKLVAMLAPLAEMSNNNG